MTAFRFKGPPPDASLLSHRVPKIDVDPQELYWFLARTNGVCYLSSPSYSWKGTQAEMGKQFDSVWLPDILQ